MNVIQISLPWPDPNLSPNSRDKWGKIKAVKEARAEATLLVFEWLQYNPQPKRPEHVNISILFYPPDKRHYDLDNLHARIKAGQDGIFTGLGWDDKLIEYIELRICRPRLFGQVTYTIETDPG